MTRLCYWFYIRLPLIIGCNAGWSRTTVVPCSNDCFFSRIILLWRVFFSLWHFVLFFACELHLIMLPFWGDLVRLHRTGLPYTPLRVCETNIATLFFPRVFKPTALSEFPSLYGRLLLFIKFGGAHLSVDFLYSVLSVLYKKKGFPFGKAFFFWGDGVVLRANSPDLSIAGSWRSRPFPVTTLSTACDNNRSGSASTAQRCLFFLVWDVTPHVLGRPVRIYRCYIISVPSF